MIPGERFVKSVSMRKGGFFVLLSGPFRVLFLVFCLSCFAPGAALAKTVHIFSSSFAGSGSSALSGPRGVAVNEETGDVYVVDRGNNRVEYFSSGGVYEGEFNGTGMNLDEGVHTPPAPLSAPEWVAVDNDRGSPSYGDVYVTDNGHKVVDKFGKTGEYLGQVVGGAGGALFGELFGVAVDPKGKLWVYQESGEIDSYSDALVNVFESKREDPFGGKSAGFAVDSEDDLYVNRGSQKFAKLNASGATLVEEMDGEQSTAAAVDPAGNDVYVDNLTSVAVFNAAARCTVASVCEVAPAEAFVERFGSPEHLVEGSGVAVNPSSGTVYVADSAGNDVAVFASVPLAEVSVDAPSNFTSSSVTLNGTVDSEGAMVTGCEFEYGSEPGVYPEKAECSPKPPLNGPAVAVSAGISGLTQGATYYYRLTATNANGTNESAQQTLVIPFPVKIEGEYVSGVNETSITFGGSINPGAGNASYRFEYGPAAGSYDASVPVPSALSGVSSSDVVVSASATGLTPGTTYHYRLAAANALPGTIYGEDKTFTTNATSTVTAESCPNAKLRAEQPYGPTLPDCRAYEMVSPLQKGDSGVGPADSRAAVSGEALTYLSYGSFVDPKAEFLQSRYLSRRGTSGWLAQNITPPYSDYETDFSENTEFGQLLFTPDLSEGVVLSPYTPLAAGEPVGYVNLYVATLEDSSYQAVSRFTPEDEYQPFAGNHNEEGGSTPRVEGTSSDQSHVVFEQMRKEGGAPPHNHVYEWAGGEPTLVDVPPTGVSFEGEDQVGASASQEDGSGAGNTWHAVSEDGSRVFFTAQENFGNEGLGQLFVRVNPLAAPQDGNECSIPADACTIEVSKSQRTPVDPNGPRPAYFRDASSDGENVFFTSRAELTNDAYTGPGDNAANLYAYNVKTGVLTDLTVNDEATTDGAAVLGLVNAGEDGSYVYFVANGVLDEGAKPGNCKLEESGEVVVVGERSCSLYVVHDGAGGWEAPRFIATLAGSNAIRFAFAGGLDGDEADWVGYEVVGYNADDRDYGPAWHTARVSGDGQLLVFESELSLTGYDNTPAQSARLGACSEHDRCSEVYLYNATSGRLVCASCDPNGARPVGSAELGGHEGKSTFYLPRNLTEDGGRLFFESPDALVPNDGNGKLDVYEWERPATVAEAGHGENSCTSVSPDFHSDDEGCVVPVSDVEGGSESRFMDASPDGDNVFISTVEQLLPSDTDTREDVYDARVGGGFPVSTTAPVCTNADSCKPPVSPQPGVFAVPASATFSGPGNPTMLALSPVVAKPVKKRVVKCKKPKKVTHGRCIKQKKAKKARRARDNRRAAR